MSTIERNCHVGKRRWLYAWLLPVLWIPVAFVSAYYPGDEYGLFVVGSAAGMWIVFIVGETGGIWKLLPFLLLAGGATMGIVGLVLDLLRAPRRLWIILWLVLAAAVCLVTIESYPSYERAMSKNESLQAYILYSLNVGLSATCLILLVIMPIWRITHRKPPSGNYSSGVADPTYDATGIGSGCGMGIDEQQTTG